MARQDEGEMAPTSEIHARSVGDPWEIHVSTCRSMRAVLTRTALTLLALTLTNSKGGTKNIHIINFIWVWRVLGGDVLHTRAVDMMMMVRVT